MVVVVIMMVVMIMVVVPVIVMVMLMIVIMVVMLKAPSTIHVGIELLGGDGLLAHVSELSDEIDYLVLEDWSAEFCQHLRVATVEVVDFPLLPRELLDALQKRAVHLVVGDLDLVAGADL